MHAEVHTRLANPALLLLNLFALVAVQALQQVREVLDGVFAVLAPVELHAVPNHAARFFQGPRIGFIRKQHMQ